ncbi:hypothetical protein Mapa_012659 [Marchantia paleacea]|nr:hypothetical protein Mapa_012659 [Marchantia paleacea]
MGQLCTSGEPHQAAGGLRGVPSVSQGNDRVRFRFPRYVDDVRRPTDARAGKQKDSFSFCLLL